ncbi:MAG: undecaprenyl-diphosphate phosphatase [Patescibacteria group bacterium]
MNFPLAAFLGILQGITEFFPISSSGHLLLAEHFFDLDVENLKAFDVVLHAGTLLALLVLFWREWVGMAVGSWQLAVGRLNEKNRESLQLLGKLAVVTIPAAFVGLLFGDWIDTTTRGENRVFLVAGFFILVAILLLAAEKFGRKNSEKVGWRNVVGMGIFQALALLPGISRSGATIAAGMLGGLSRSAAAKFSFLMLAPVTLGATILISKKVCAGELTLPPLEFTLVGFAVSAVSSFLFASLLLKFVKKYSLVWFAVYLILAAVVVLIFTNFWI